jgi:hypothetical protein
MSQQVLFNNTYFNYFLIKIVSYVNNELVCTCENITHYKYRRKSILSFYILGLSMDWIDFVCSELGHG